ncbi:unnamed protein product [Protopolystoma xenopodis]|uniref:Uncharacterized protein n=1 Tax=Protopolystoma xenopodis TaxID=117903 RepID=A0A448WIV4_9PLAT|nr:unnamed protein product [Protopolystoma xenopodis]
MHTAAATSSLGSGSTPANSVVNAPAGMSEQKACFEVVTIAMHSVRQCKCHRRKVEVKRQCCVPPPRSRLHCQTERGRKIRVLTRYTLVQGRVRSLQLVLATDTLDGTCREYSLIVFDKKLETQTQMTTKQIICPVKKVHEVCDRKSGLWQQTLVHYIRKGCQCQSVRSVKRGKCGKICPTYTYSLPFRGKLYIRH